MFDQLKNTIRDILFNSAQLTPERTLPFTYSIIELRIDLPQPLYLVILPVTINLFVFIINTLQSRNLIISVSNCIKIGEYVMIANLPCTCMLGTSIMRSSIWLDAEVFNLKYIEHTVYTHD